MRIGELSLVWAAAGAALGLGLLALLRKRPPASRLRVLAAGLAIAALIYLLAASFSGSPGWVGIEAGGLAFFALFALLSSRSPGWLALGWLLHTAWDVGLHGGARTPFVPAFYPALCLGFDLLVALALFWPLRRRTSGQAPL